jgi:ribosome-binding factor A
VQRSLSKIINEVIVDDKIGFISITRVDTVADLNSSTVYYSILNNEPHLVKKAEELIDQHKPYIRMELAKIISNIKKIPLLIFKFDEGLSYEREIDEVLRDIKNKEKK